MAVLISIIFSMFMCLFKDSVAAPNVCIGFAIIIPLIVLGIVRGLPVKSLSSDSAEVSNVPTHSYMLRTAIICTFIYASALVLCLILCSSRLVTPLGGVRIDSRAL